MTGESYVLQRNLSLTDFSLFVNSTVNLSAGVAVGTVNSTRFLDSVFYNVSEVTGANPLTVRLNFTGVQNFTGINFYGAYDGNPAHNVYIRVLANNGSWMDLGLWASGTMGWYNYTLTNGTNYVADTGLVQVEINHTSSGAAGHLLSIDYAELKLPTNITRACLDVRAPNTVINMNGFWILGNNTENSTGVMIIAVNNTTVSNGYFNNTPVSIYSQGNYTTVFNNTLSVPVNTTANAERWQGIYLFNNWFGNVSYNRVTNVSASAIALGAIPYYPNGILLYSNSKNNTISYNQVTTWGTNAMGVFLYASSSSNSIFSNNITTVSGSGLFLYSSTSFNSVYLNNVSVLGSGNGVYLNSIASNNSVFSNNVTTTGSGSGVYVSSSSNNSVFSNNIITTGGGHGVYLNSASNNSVFSNIVNVTTGVGNGVYLGTSSNNSIFGNNVTTTGSGFGVRVITVSRNNLFSSNIIKTSAVDTVRVGWIDGPASNSNNSATFTNDVLNCTGTCTRAIFINQSSSVVFTNVSFNRSRVVIGHDESYGTNNLTIKWFVDVNVTFSNGSAASNIFVNVTNGTYLNQLRTNDLIQTSANGIARYVVLSEFINFTTSWNYTPHYFTALSATNTTMAITYPSLPITKYTYILFNYTEKRIDINTPTTGQLFDKGKQISFNVSTVYANQTLEPNTPFQITLIDPASNGYFVCSSFSDSLGFGYCNYTTASTVPAGTTWQAHAITINAPVYDDVRFITIDDLATSSYKLLDTSTGLYSTSFSSGITVNAQITVYSELTNSTLNNATNATFYLLDAFGNVFGTGNFSVDGGGSYHYLFFLNTNFSGSYIARAFFANGSVDRTFDLPFVVAPTSYQIQVTTSNGQFDATRLYFNTSFRNTDTIAAHYINYNRSLPAGLLYASQIFSAPNGTEVYDYDLGVWKVMYNLTIPADAIIERQVLTQIIYSPTEQVLSDMAIPSAIWEYAGITILALGSLLLFYLADKLKSKIFVYAASTTLFFVGMLLLTKSNDPTTVTGALGTFAFIVAPFIILANVTNFTQPHPEI